MRYGGKRQAKIRPEYFRLDATHPLARGLFFAGLQYMGSLKSASYHDSCAELRGSAAANHGTLTNMIPSEDWQWVPELGRWALDFDGSNDFVVIPRSLLLEPASTVTVALYLKTVATSGYPLGKQKDTTSGSYYITASANAVRFGVTAGGSPLNGADLTSCQDGTWHHICGVYDGVEITVYKDGNTVGSPVAKSGAINYVDEELYLGRYGDLFPTILYCACTIGDPIIWSRALALPEIKLLADRSDPFLGGLIQPPRRKTWAAVTAASSGRNIRIFPGATNLISLSN